MPEQTTTETTQTTQQTQTPQGDGQTAAPASFDEWIASAPDAVKGLVTSHIEGLQNTVKATRAERDEFARQLRAAAKAAPENSDARRALDEMAAKAEAAELRAAFFEDASRPEIGCTNPRLAYLAAQQDGAIDAKGRVHWEALRGAYPELFRRTAPATNAGAGTQNAKPASGGMNEYIRRAAGRQ